jgi:GTP cyclohydrolase I
MGKNLKKNTQLMEKIHRTMLDIYDLEGANFWETPKRVAKLWDNFLNIDKPKLKAFPTNNNSMVIVDQFDTWSFCPHHLLPVKYTFKIGFIPQDKSLGLSKFPRLAEYILSKLPLQEDIPELILKEIQDTIKPLGCGCRVWGYHLCSVMRGVKCPNIRFVTTALKGVMLHSPASQNEFLST